MTNKLKEKRKEMKLRMIDVALKTGVGVSTIWLIENGYSERISKETKQKIAAGLNTTVEELFNYEEK
ncbi:MAG: helix-turn-helix transcriptional regulator [Candidatus Aminicenantes bacterium]|nr:helix-turn-helix transcriptional regulator [Candidatus Aminicenantes bacterium]